MLRFKQYLMEVAKAKSEVDKEVVANHPIKVTNTPFPDSGETVVKTKKDTSRRADNQPGEDENKYSAHNKPGKVAEYHESEELDEISKERIAQYSKKAMSQTKGNQPSDPDKFRKRTNREAGIKTAYNKYHNWKAKVAATESVNESQQLDEISKERAMSYHDKAVSDSQPLAAKKKKSEDQFRNRIRSGKPLKDFKPKDKLSGDEERKLRNREKWTTKVRNKHLYNESEYETENNKRKVKRIKHEKGEIKIMSGRAKEDNE